MRYLLYDLGLRGVGEVGGRQGLINSQYHSNKEIIIGLIQKNIQE